MGRPIFSPGYYAAVERDERAQLAAALNGATGATEDEYTFKHQLASSPHSDYEDLPDFRVESTSSLHCPIPSSNNNSHVLTEERFLDPTSPEALRMLLPSLTRHLSPLAQRLALCLNPSILANATRFTEQVDDQELLTLRAWNNDNQLVGVCHLRLDGDEALNDEDSELVLEEEEEEEELVIERDARRSSLRISSDIIVQPSVPSGHEGNGAEENEQPISPSSTTFYHSTSIEMGPPPSPRRTVPGRLGAGWAEAARSFMNAGELI